jgi:hypothetical protein
VYEGSGGGLGPYHGPAGSGGQAPGLGAMGVLVAAVAVFAAGRRRQG